jgi:zinc protease
MPSGVDLTYVRRDALPEVMLAIGVPAGSASVGVNRAGLASLVAKVIPEGAGGRDSRQMAEWLDRMGAQLTVAAGYDSLVLRLHTLTESLEPALDALAAVCMAPDFPEAEVERCRGERLDAIRRARDEPSEVSDDVLAELMFGEHPYGRLPRGRETTVEGLDRDDLADFQAERFDPRSAVLVASGRLPDGFEGQVASRFGDWSAAGGEDTSPGDVAEVDSASIVLVDRPGSRQSEIRIGGIGLRRGDPEEAALRVANAILGGLFNSRLNLNLREEKGWTYGARSSLSLRRARGPIVLRAAVETSVTAAAIREMLSEASRLGEERPSPGEMRTAAGALTRSLPLRFETSAQIVGRIVEERVYGLPPDYWQRFPAMIEAVEPEQVRAVSSRLLNPAAMSVVVVGDAGAVRSDLESLGTVQVRPAP